MGARQEREENEKALRHILAWTVFEVYHALCDIHFSEVLREELGLKTILIAGPVVIQASQHTRLQFQRIIQLLAFLQMRTDAGMQHMVGVETSQEYHDMIAGRLLRNVEV
jgi:hypothetical protein